MQPNYQTKPRRVQALRVGTASTAMAEIREFFGGPDKAVTRWNSSAAAIEIRSFDSDHNWLARPGDWLVRNGNGDVMVDSNGRFEQSYEPIPEGQA